jgi:uncharacterized membrane protein YqhA
MLEKWRRAERAIIIASRVLTGVAVVGSLLGSVLMFALGLCDIYTAFVHALSSTPPGTNVPSGAATVISVILALDRFLIALVLLYFAYGVYSLFIHPEIDAQRAAEEMALPVWMRIRQIGQLKQVVAELILVILFVLFLRHALQVFQAGTVVTLGWGEIATLLVLPLCTLFLAIGLRLVELHPKPGRSASGAGGAKGGAGTPSGEATDDG